MVGVFKLNSLISQKGFCVHNPIVLISVHIHLYKLGHKQVNNVSVRLMDICASYDERMIHAMLLATHVHACAIVHAKKNILMQVLT